MIWFVQALCKRLMELWAWGIRVRIENFVTWERRLKFWFLNSIINTDLKHFFTFLFLIQKSVYQFFLSKFTIYRNEKITIKTSNKEFHTEDSTGKSETFYIKKRISFIFNKNWFFPSPPKICSWLQKKFNNDYVQ